VAVVRFVLRDKDDIRFFNLGQVTDRTRNDSLGDGKPFRIHDGTADKPRID